MKVITIKIKLDVDGVEKGINDIGNGLDEISKIDAKNAKKALDNLDQTTLNQVKSQTNSASAALAKVTQLTLKFDNQLAKLREHDTELSKLNRTLSQPGVASKIDETTKAILRQKAAAVDSAQQANQNLKNGIGGFFSTVVGATIISSATSKALSLVTDLASEVKDLGIESLELSANFEQTNNAFVVFTGSARRAKDEIAAIDKAARDTDGLRLEAAEAGTTELRSLGFEAETSRKLIVGLAKQRLINPNIEEGAIKRVIVNLTQLSSGSIRASQDLKEIIQAIPTLRPVLEDAFKTLDPQRIAAIFKNTPDEALKKFADSLEKAKAPAGGLNSAIDKLYDSFVEVGRAFGTPILDPLTTDVKNLTDFINENRKSFADFGQEVSDILRGVNITIEELKKRRDSNTTTSSLARFFGYDNLEDFNRDFQRAFESPLKASDSDLKKIGITPLDEIGRNARTADARRQVQGGLQLKSGIGKEFQDLTAAELLADQQNAERLANRAKEVARQQDLDFLKLNSKEAEQILKNRYEVEKALLDSSIRYTSDQEKQYIEQSVELKNRAIQSEIALKTGQFNKEIALNEGNFIEIAKLESEKNLTIGKLQNDLKLNAINGFKEIQQVEKKILNERRQAAIEFQNLNIQEVNFQVDNELSDIKRSIQQRNDFVNKGYDRLLEITNKGYGLILQATKDSLALQLQDQTLSDEQRSNLIKKGYLEEAKLAEENRRKIIQIEDDRYQKQISNLKSYTEFVKGQFQDLNGLFEGVGSFFNPNTFNKSTSGNLQEILLQKSEVDKLKRQIEESKNNENSISKSRDLFFANLPQNDNSALTSKQTEAINKLNDAYFTAIDTTSKYLNQLNAITDSIPNAYREFDKLAESVGGGNIKAFDDAAEKLLEIKQRLETADIDADIDLVNSLINLAKAKGESTLELDRQLSRLTSQKQKLGIDQQIESIDLYAKSLQGLNKQIEELKNNDPETITALNRVFEGEKRTEQISQLTEIKRLQFELANTPLINTNAIEIAQLQDLIELRNRDTNAIIDANKARLELANKGNFSQLQSDAKVLEFINQNIKSVTDSVTDFRIGLGQTYLDAITSPFDALSQKLEKLNPVVRTLAQTFLNFARDLVKAFSQKLILRLLGLESPTGNNGSQSSGGGIGNFLKNLLGGIFGGGNANGIGGTPNFNPNAGLNTGDINALGQFVVNGNSSGSSNFSPNSTQSGGGGGLLNLISGLFGGGRNGQLLGGTTSALGGILKTRDGTSINSGGVGGGVLGQILGPGGLFGDKGFGFNSGTISTLGAGAGLIGSLIGGRTGSILTGVGAGIGVAGSLGSILGISALGGPVGLLIGGAVGGLIALLGQNSKRRQEEKLRTQYLREAIAGLGDFDKLITDLKNARVDPDSAIEQGNAIAETLRTNYLQRANSLTDKKTRRIALSAVSELDFNIGVKKSELAQAAGKARNAAEIDRQLIPEFATGNFFGRGGTDDQLAEMLRLLDNRRGFIAGGQLGVDRHLGLFADGEAILNQQQQIRINQVAGFDVLAEAGIPNYPKQRNSPTIPRFETGAFFGTNAVSSSSNSSNQTKPQFNVTVVINSSGMVESDIMDVVVDGISNNFEVQTALVKNGKKSKRFRE